MIELIKVAEVEPVGAWRLRVRFSNGREGIRDFSDLVREGGPMLESLKDQQFFQKVFIEYGVLTWPNGFDLDSIALHDEMMAAGLLQIPVSA